MSLLVKKKRKKEKENYKTLYEEKTFIKFWLFMANKFVNLNKYKIIYIN